MFAAAGSGGQVRRHFLLKIPQAFFSMLFGDYLVPMDELAVLNIRETLLGHWHYLALGLLAIGMLFLLCVRKFSFKDEALSFLAITALSPVLMAIVVSLKVMLFEERYFFFTTPYLYALVVWGLISIPKNRWPILTILVILLSTSTFNYFFHERFGKDQWREAVQYVEDNYQEGDRLILLPNYIDICWDYYKKKEIPTLKVTGKREEIGSEGWEEVKEFGLASPRLWYVRSFLRNDSQPKWFAERFSSDIKLHLKNDKGIEIYLFDGNPNFLNE